MVQQVGDLEEMEAAGKQREQPGYPVLIDLPVPVQFSMNGFVSQAEPICITNANATAKKAQRWKTGTYATQKREALKPRPVARRSEKD